MKSRSVRFIESFLYFLVGTETNAIRIGNWLTSAQKYFQKLSAKFFPISCNLMFGVVDKQSTVNSAFD